MKVVSPVRHALALVVALVAAMAVVLAIPPPSWRLPLGLLLFVSWAFVSHRRLKSKALPETAAAPVVDPRVSAIQAEMSSELLATLRTLERTYEPLRGATDREVVQRQTQEEPPLPDLRTVLMRLRLLIPSLAAGRPVLPDMALQRQQTLAAREQSDRERAELGQTLALQRHVASLQTAVEAVLATHKKARTGFDASTLETLLSRIEQAHHAVQVLQLTLEAR